MYVSSFLTLDTALSGVEAAQEELSTTGQNISNANTPGYEQQRVNLVESTPLNITGNHYQLGTGVNATGITNTGDPYLDSAWRQVNSNSSGATTAETYLTQAETLIGEPSTSGIASQLSGFWSDWSELADNPTSTSAKQAVVDDGNQLASSFNSISSELTGSGPTSILSQAETQYADVLAAPTGSGASGGQVYNDAYNIASLNQSIVQATAAGENPNTLIDQRNAAIDDLSGLGNVNVTANTDGSVSVYFGGVTSTALVADPVGSANASAPDPGNNFSGSWTTAWNTQFATADAAAATAAASSGTTQSAAALASSVGGTLGALIGLTGFSASGVASPSNAATSIGSIGTIASSLDGVVASLVNEVNNPPVVGSSGTTATLTTPFFTATGTTASTISVNSALVANPSAVQVSTSGNPGDNDIALDEANNSGGTTDGAYDAFVEQIGALVSDAKDTENTQSALATQVTNQRDSVEGVDLSQEMENLIQEQQAYEASAKVMNAFSTMMNALMSTVGQ